MFLADISGFNTLSDLKAAPINPGWIIEGAPIARNLKVAGSSDHSAWTMLWDCTAGKFHWIYKVDETVHVLEGSVTITMNGKINILRAGDIAFFPAGSVAQWHIESYVRKLAFCQKPLPMILNLPLRAVRRVLSQFHKGVTLVQGSLAEPLPNSDAQREQPNRSQVRMQS
jgi:hypothetical protein